MKWIGNNANTESQLLFNLFLKAFMFHKKYLFWRIKKCDISFNSLPTKKNVKKENFNKNSLINNVFLLGLCNSICPIMDQILFIHKI